MGACLPLPYARAGAYQVFGFFRFIENLEVFNLPPNEPKPALPTGNYKMDLMVSCMHAAAGLHVIQYRALDLTCGPVAGGTVWYYVPACMPSLHFLPRGPVR